MNWDIAEGKWDQIASKFKEKWAKLTDDDLKLIQGKRDNLLGKLQEKYGKRKEDFEHEVDNLIKKIQ